MPRSNIRKKIFSMYPSTTLPCVWCLRRLHRNDKDCTVEHILCSCIKELRSDSLDNCKIACADCNTSRSLLCLPEMNTYRFMRILKGQEEEGSGDKRHLDNYLRKCKDDVRKIDNQSLYNYMLENFSKFGNYSKLKMFTNNIYHQYYMKEFGKLLGVEIRYLCMEKDKLCLVRTKQ